jgi:hypothetical protein
VGGDKHGRGDPEKQLGPETRLTCARMRSSCEAVTTETDSLIMMGHTPDFWRVKQAAVEPKKRSLLH